MSPPKCRRSLVVEHLIRNQFCKKRITREEFKTYMKMISLEILNAKWTRMVERWLIAYLDYIDWEIDEDSTLDYLSILKDKYSISTYKKIGYHIRKFADYCGCSWAKRIKMPRDVQEKNIRILKTDDIRSLIEQFRQRDNFLQCKSAILLTSTSGLRSFELYRLKESDIDLDNRIVYITAMNAKTKKARATFFNKEAKEAIEDYLAVRQYDCLFGDKTMQRSFKKAPLKVKHLRKFFSQEWDRRLGPTGVKKRLMGHSIRGDVDLQHYSYLDTDDLKKIYDKVIPEYMITKP